MTLPNFCMMMMIFFLKTLLKTCVSCIFLFSSTKQFMKVAQLENGIDVHLRTCHKEMCKSFEFFSHAKCVTIDMWMSMCECYVISMFSMFLSVYVFTQLFTSKILLCIAAASNLLSKSPIQFCNKMRPVILLKMISQHSIITIKINRPFKMLNERVYCDLKVAENVHLNCTVSFM